MESPVEGEFVLGRFLAWLIQSIVTLLKDHDCVHKERKLVVRMGSFRLSWFSLEKFTR